MPKDIRIAKFTGMNNIEEAGDLFAKKEVAIPRIVLNADVTDDGRIEKREGFTEDVVLTDGHSQWAGSTCHLVMDGTTLKRKYGDSVTTIENLGGPKTRMFYAEVGKLVYISNNQWNGIFDPDTDTISDWGITLPFGPAVSSTAGSLPAGTYHVCFTAESGGEISGNGPISQIVLTSVGGISISNRGADDIVWCTDPDGDIFYRIGKQDTITAAVSVEPIPSLFCYPPPFMENLSHAFGRMWGSVENKVYYSDPFQLPWWKRGSSVFEFATNVTLIAKTKSCLFVGCADRTYSLLGTKPEEMQMLDVGAGAVPGTLAYCNNIIELGDTISPPEKKHESVPVWVSEEGIVAGNPVGRLFSLSQQKVRFVPGNIGASLYRKKGGEFQFLTTFPKGGEQEGLGMSDSATVEVFRNGVVI